MDYGSKNNQEQFKANQTKNQQKQKRTTAKNRNETKYRQKNQKIM
ncbi:hypothetical protein SAMN03003324_01229 [Pedobacter antarcticus]|uniref:Uncharacterized protein n=1 Tax=Pedobacter antarcticus TaxID=34086 RepID=A0A1I2CW99_9SPHI|nr:hypothetical protein SAMN03003324_01229 [Pedobacter antarcticus]